MGHSLLIGLNKTNLVNPQELRPSPYRQTAVANATEDPSRGGVPAGTTSLVSTHPFWLVTGTILRHDVGGFPEKLVPLRVGSKTP